ncbi:MAG TPA: DUF5666 domain-containing protein [Terriglobales bacterium]|nr:DUF5666 domain-containing protein [Terriglobales bacterium]
MAFAGAGSYRRRLGGLALTLLLLFLAVGCGDSSKPVQPSSAVQVKVGDAAADRVVAFEMTLTSLVLTASNGQQVAVLPGARRIEFTRLAGTMEPVALLNIPQGFYSEAALAGKDIHLTYIDALGAIREYTNTAAISTSMRLNPQLGVTASSIISVDLNLAASIVSLDPTNVEPPQFEPVYSFSISPVSATEQKEEQGGLKHVLGVVTAADSNSFTMQLGQNGTLLTFLVDASTLFQDVTLTTLPNMIVEVDGVTAANGTLYAERVAGLTSASGAVVEGMLSRHAFALAGFTKRTARPEVPLVVQDGVGHGMVDALVGTPVTLDFSTASYGVNGEGMPDGWAFDLIGGLVFNVATMVPGQAVQVVTGSGIIPLDGGYTIPARTVTLQEQAASGVVSNYRDGLFFTGVLGAQDATFSPRSALSMPVGAFDLQLPEDSYLRLLNPSFASVTVGVFPETKVYGTSAISDLMTVRVRGWLFYFNDELAMVADRIDFVAAPAPTAARTSVPGR